MDNVKKQTPDIYGLFVFSALPQLKASTAYDNQYAGFYASIAVADTGVDGTHTELSNIKAGRSWHGSKQGLSDPDGHGTHAVCRAIELGIAEDDVAMA